MYSEVYPVNLLSLFLKALLCILRDILMFALLDWLGATAGRNDNDRAVLQLTLPPEPLTGFTHPMMSADCGFEATATAGGRAVNRVGLLTLLNPLSCPYTILF